jgi:hypothetical protein
MKKLSLLALIGIIASQAMAQNLKDSAPQAPKTKLEAFEAKTGAVIVQGFSKIGEVTGRYSTSASIECKEFTEASSGKKEYGIIITVKKAGDYEHENTSYIDYDEIDSLIKGIDYITKVDKSATKLDYVQADYKTKGDLMVSTYSDDNGKIQASVQSGIYGAVSAYLSLDDLADFKNLIQKAKDKLDSIKTDAPKN